MRATPPKSPLKAALDGVYVVRTTVAEVAHYQTATVAACKQFSTDERVFRSITTVTGYVMAMDGASEDR